MNAYCIKGLISIRIVTPLTSEAIIVTMRTLSDTVKANIHACFAFTSVTGVQFSHVQLSHRSSNFRFGLYFGSVQVIDYQKYI